MSALPKGRFQSRDENKAMDLSLMPLVSLGLAMQGEEQERMNGSEQK